MVEELKLGKPKSLKWRKRVEIIFPRKKQIVNEVFDRDRTVYSRLKIRQKLAQSMSMEKGLELETL